MLFYVVQVSLCLTRQTICARSAEFEYIIYESVVFLTLRQFTFVVRKKITCKTEAQKKNCVARNQKKRVGSVNKVQRAKEKGCMGRSRCQGKKFSVCVLRRRYTTPTMTEKTVSWPTTYDNERNIDNTKKKF